MRFRRSNHGRKTSKAPREEHPKKFHSPEIISHPRTLQARLSKNPSSNLTPIWASTRCVSLPQMPCLCTITKAEDCLNVLKVPVSCTEAEVSEKADLLIIDIKPSKVY